MTSLLTQRRAAARPHETEGKLVDAWSDNADIEKATIWIELGPRIVTVPCDDAHLHDDVTSRWYKKGKKDAYGAKIGAAKEMHCVDWKQNFAPKAWKIYQRQKTGVVDSDFMPVGAKSGDPITQMARVGETAELHEAMFIARDLMEGAA